MIHMYNLTSKQPVPRQAADDRPIAAASPTKTACPERAKSVRVALERLCRYLGGLAVLYPCNICLTELEGCAENLKDLANNLSSSASRGGFSYL
eukprot:754254-Hanusia_phi.AAC.1